jgi:trimeric autotransporter adhesin
MRTEDKSTLHAAVMGILFLLATANADSTDTVLDSALLLNANDFSSAQGGPAGDRGQVGFAAASDIATSSMSNWPGDSIYPPHDIELGHGMLKDMYGEPSFASREIGGNASTVSGEWIAFPGVNFGCDGPIIAMTEGDDGSVFLGGDFQSCDDTVAHNVVRYDPVEQQFHPLDDGGIPGVNDRVFVLEVVDGDLLVGGFFDTAGSVPINYLARWNGDEWAQLGDGLQHSGIGRVMALKSTTAGLVVGGLFDTAGGIEANNIARWDGNEWHSVGSGSANGVNGSVRALAVYDDELYVGGSFSDAGGQLVRYVARWDGLAWSPLEDGGYVGVAGFFARVWALQVFDDELYVGGVFSGAGGGPANNIARWNGGQWAAVGDPVQGVNNAVESFSVLEGELVVGGQFTTAAGIASNRVARWSGSEWLPLSDADGEGLNSMASSLLVANNGLYVGGYFAYAGGQSVSHIARWDSDGWSPVGSNTGQLGVNGTVATIFQDGNDVYIGGAFSTVGNGLANNIARWDGSEWHVLGSGNDNGVNGEVRSILRHGGDLVVGGYFNSAGGQEAFRVAVWDGLEWTPLGGQLDGPVTAMAIHGGALYIGGWFNEDDGNVLNGVARWSGEQWQPLTGSEGVGVNGLVHSIESWGEDLYVAGSFASAGGIVANRIARWNATESEWHPLVVNGHNGLTGTINDIRLAGIGLYVTGSFSDIGGDLMNNIARWDGQGWHSIEQPDGAVGVNSTGRVLAVDGEQLYVGGSFVEAGGIPVNRVGRWNGSQWASIGEGDENGLDGSHAQSLAVEGNRIYVGGSFTRAGNRLSSAFAIFEMPVDKIFHDGFEE